MSASVYPDLGRVLIHPDGSKVSPESLRAPGPDAGVLALYFCCSWSGSCRQFTQRLREFEVTVNGAWRAAPKRLEVVLVSSDQAAEEWEKDLDATQWLSVPFEEQERKLLLWKKFKVTSVPALILLDSYTGKLITKNGVAIVSEDPSGAEFPWKPRLFSEVMEGPLIRNGEETLDMKTLEGSHLALYFSAHWCPPCRSFTPFLVETYKKLKSQGEKFEIIFVSSDRSLDSFKQYFGEMPWLAVPYSDEKRRLCLNRLYGIQGIPSLIILDLERNIITPHGRAAVVDDPECKEFPWHPKPVNILTESNATFLHQGPCLVLFVDSEEEELELAKQLLQPIAEKIIAESKVQEEEPPLVFYCAEDDDISDSLRDFTNLPESAPLLSILDIATRAKFVKDVEEITPSIVEDFVRDFLEGKLQPEPI
ncbi:nucleoredoxin-like [Latimeria chalumnae]|uniref:Nucleoredoxin n=1 Tax=Latimeria chalumnae TaxID=7897 RepID=H3A932_LATCH|nr:PREDICTED: nucleoredoxin-like [Latimeria chalumnae]|eukprot:XP_006008021.1 PREDICTED: nucleoredoxin-like [Latimeria chalumnae]